MLSLLGYPVFKTVTVPSDAVTSETAEPGNDFPKIDGNRRAYFRLHAPSAQHVVADICGKKYDMQRDEQGTWTGVSDPLPVGFHYYFFWVDGVQVYFIDNEYYFGGRTGAIYGDLDDGERFAFFSRACLDAMDAVNYIPDIIQCNDWQAREKKANRSPSSRSP